MPCTRGAALCNSGCGIRTLRCHGLGLVDQFRQAIGNLPCVFDLPIPAVALAGVGGALAGFIAADLKDQGACEHPSGERLRGAGFGGRHTRRHPSIGRRVLPG